MVITCTYSVVTYASILRFYVTMKMLVYSVTTRTFHKIYVVFTIFSIFDHNMTLKEAGTL